MALATIRVAKLIALALEELMQIRRTTICVLRTLTFQAQVWKSLPGIMEYCIVLSIQRINKCMVFPIKAGAFQSCASAAGQARRGENCYQAQVDGPKIDPRTSWKPWQGHQQSRSWCLPNLMEFRALSTQILWKFQMELHAQHKDASRPVTCRQGDSQVHWLTLDTWPTIICILQLLGAKTTCLRSTQMFNVWITRCHCDCIVNWYDRLRIEDDPQASMAIQ